MDGLLGQLVNLAAITSVAILLLFGQQFDGVIPALRKRQKKAKVEKVDVTAQDSAAEASQSSIAPIADAPKVTHARQAKPEPRYVFISRMMTERGQLKAARWTLILPQLLNHFGVFPLFIGTFLCLIVFYFNLLISFATHQQLFAATNPDVVSWIAIIGGILWLGALFLQLIAWVIPIFMGHASDIAVLLHKLKS